MDAKMQDAGDRSRWGIVAAWFGTIVLLGVLKRILERQQKSSL